MNQKYLNPEQIAARWGVPCEEPELDGVVVQEVPAGRWSLAVAGGGGG
jgi:hypothetical protein